MHTFDTVKDFLNQCERSELRDHAFGDRELFWAFDGVDVAGGYFNRDGRSVWINDCEIVFKGDVLMLVHTEFSGDEALELSKCGKVGKIYRNDMQGDSIPSYEGA